MTVYLCTGTDENYYPKIQPYIDTLYRFSPFPTIVFTVGFTERFGKYDDICYFPIPNTALTDITTNPCVQAGEFLPHCEFLYDDDIILFTDGDIRLQREFTQEEIDLVENLEHFEFLAGPNATHDGNTLWNEANGLRRYCSDDELNAVFMEFEVEPWERTLNMGVIACTAYTYRNIFEVTYEAFRWHPNITHHMARQQWYMNLAAYHLCRGNVKLLPYTFHSHPHNGDQPGMRFDPDGTMYVYGDQKVLFRHKYHV